MEKASFAAGCFWQVEELFKHLPGVTSTIVGYAGGHAENPSYEDVCSGETGHAESVEVEYNPEEISYEKLLEEFWKGHDPTTVNRQGPDIGSQYRSIIFYHSEEQKTIAEESKKKFNESGEWKDEIVTEILPAKEFYKAEEYHQQYEEKNGSCKKV